MSSSWGTRDQERAILKLLLTSHHMTRMYLYRVKPEWMRSIERRFILDTAKGVYEDNKSLLKQNTFDFALKTSKEENDLDTYIAEWNLIQGLIVEDAPEALLDIFDKAEKARKVSDMFNEVQQKIENGNIEEAITLLKKGSTELGISGGGSPIVDIRDYQHRKQLIDDKRKFPEKYLGVKTGFFRFDQLTGGLFPAELTLIAALTGVGKSTLMKQVSFNMAGAGRIVLHITNEEHSMQVQTKYDAVVAEVPYSDFKKATITDADLKKWEDSMTAMAAKTGTVYIKEIPQFSTATEIEGAILELDNRGIKVDAVVIDYLDHMMPIVKGWGEYDEAAKAAADLKQLAVDFNIPVVTATQAATEAEKKQDKGKKFGKMDVYGSKRKVHSANTFMAIRQEKQDTEQLYSKENTKGDRDYLWECDWLWVIDVLKNRDGGTFSFRARHKVKTGRVEFVKYDDDPEEASSSSSSSSSSSGSSSSGSSSSTSSSSTSSSSSPSSSSGTNLTIIPQTTEAPIIRRAMKIKKK